MEADFIKLTHARGERVVDLDGRRIGKVTNIAFEPNTYRADWLVVKTSMFGRPRLVPVATAVEEGHEIRVPFLKATVLNAPVPTIPLTPAMSECTALEEHYRRAA
jgi:sporulation protein YlmC with PRC-barrel domain